MLEKLEEVQILNNTSDSALFLGDSSNKQNCDTDHVTHTEK